MLVFLCSIIKYILFEIVVVLQQCGGFKSNRVVEEANWMARPITIKGS